MDSVLVPLDGSRPSWNALDFALSEHGTCSIEALYVVDTSPLVSYTGGLGGNVTAAASDHRQERADDLFEVARDVAATAGREIHTAVEYGRPPDVIVDYARTNAIDQVVMGSHCRTGVSRMTMGSVAERVLRRSSVPVTVVP